MITLAGQGHPEATADSGRVILISTTSQLARTKQIRPDAEQLIQRSTMKRSTQLPTMTHVASGDRNLSRLLTTLRRVPVPPVSGGEQHLQQLVRVDVADLAGAVLIAAAGNGYDVAGPVPLTSADLLRIRAEQLQCLTEDKASAVDDAARDLMKHPNAPQSKSAARGRHAA